jgi:hypothetical protein
VKAAAILDRKLTIVGFGQHLIIEYRIGRIEAITRLR